MHHQIQHSPELLASVQGKTALITGAARGIGAATACLFNKHGANVVITDLSFLRESAEQLIDTLEHPGKAIFVPGSITDWAQLRDVFKQGIAKFGRIDIVVANAGIMESNTVLDVDVDDYGDPIESAEAVKVLDVNLKGTLNTLRLGLHYISQNQPASPENPDRGSIVLVSSTSGYFGTTGNAAYIASKHGTVGLLRASQAKATSLGIRINSIAPNYTPTYITAGFDRNSIKEAGLEVNTPEMVGTAIMYAAVDPERRGTCCLVAGQFLRELELTQKSFVSSWLGEDLAGAMARFGKFLAETGGYKLPPSTKII
ncbi:3-hydroxyacyl-CoA dehydrogenase type-2 [Microdochium bolleyi]|uniref:3-hydroxyacyl-CoA dehydrogenase type-2 n=1 Tax=Microdochium bolleyi TaxID=196109 RepID=A0A136IYN8_9PEZI|nr:3-hydroxyacyl-CoA dehydrogenase type-2 [Microdochium bolleyi]